ncbi:hypothetical protein CPB83DRAFT_852942 [Crepidotus variabilis]|uniref:Uncharacterized protein n=1 Tax=Crepidotus variabilis TaxID=179855 RepID=A0A9P6JR68_9AGAR|nr:hypothetical protein CPB83DRAFT_852942 [Crepidotus variabilis]
MTSRLEQPITLTLASNFPTLMITDIPVLSLSEKDQARHFISLLDAFYETRRKIICLPA